MEPKIVIVKKTLRVEGMTCPSCELRIENKLKNIPGITEVTAKYVKQTVDITYNSENTNTTEIIKAIESLDYKVIKTQEKEEANKKTSIKSILGIGVIIFAVYLLISNTIGFNFIPEVNQNMGYGILFLIGILTSLHCVAMCGGINLSQCVSYKTEKDDKLSKLKPAILYNAGRVVSYTIIGGIVGVLGSVISLSGATKGFVAIIAGIFMVIMGLNMLDIFPWLRKLTPKMPKIFGKKIHSNNGKRGPFYVGLLNGLMPCGPLQTMQIYALGTGSFFAGALSMFMFSLGTVPLMFGFGFISSLLSSKFTHKMMKVSAGLVMVLGIVMLNNGLSLSGFNPISIDIAGKTTQNVGAATITDNVQYITTKINSGRYSPITVQKGIPVKWTIQAAEEDLNGCNNEIRINEYDKQLKLKAGDNVIEFIPTKTGTFIYSCWMGMIRSQINVVDNIETAQPQTADATPPANSAVGSGGGCCAASALATDFANGNIPTDNIQIAKDVNGIEEATVTVNNKGYSPAVIVIEKGKEFKLKFNPEEINSCNYVINFPDYGGGIDLNNDTETPVLTAESDFTFECAMSMLHGYVKVVDDINNVDIEAIKSEVENFVPASGSGGGCH